MSQPARLILLNKPFQVLCQFSDRQETGRQTLADFIQRPGFYPAGRLDFDSEGLLLLTDSGDLQNRVAHPKQKLAKHYWVQVEGEPSNERLQQLSTGVQLGDGITRPATARALESAPALWARQPPVIEHREQRSHWLELVITEGRNRQVRRMCAAVGLPVLRLVRHQVGHWQLGELRPGQYREESVNLPTRPAVQKQRARRHSRR